MIQNLVLEYRLRKLEKVVGGSMPKYFYHGTSSALAKRILEDGLKPSKDSKRRAIRSFL